MIAAKYPTRFLRSYVRSKLARDPMYEAVLAHVRDSAEPLLDVGCGVGVLEAFLRDRGVRPGAIVVLHQGRPKSLQTIENVVDALQRKGYALVIPDDARLKTKR